MSHRRFYVELGKLPLGLVLAYPLIFGACTTQTVPITGRVQAIGVSEKRMNARSAVAYRKAVTSAALPADDPRSIRVARVANQLVKATESYFREMGKSDEFHKYSWEFHVIRDESLNAFCYPGGKIAVHTGMFEVLVTDHHLAATIAHEIAHALANHIAERATDELLVGTLISMASEYDMGRTIGITSMYSDMARLGMLLPHNRFQESEADHIGLIIMAMAGFRPEAAGDVWRLMQSIPRSDSTPNYLSTHPTDQYRMRQLDALVPTVIPIYNAAQKSKKRR